MCEKIFAQRNSSVNYKRTSVISDIVQCERCTVNTSAVLYIFHIIRITYTFLLLPLISLSTKLFFSISCTVLPGKRISPHFLLLKEHHVDKRKDANKISDLSLIKLSECQRASQHLYFSSYYKLQKGKHITHLQ